MNFQGLKKYGIFFVYGAVFLLMFYLNSCLGFLSDDFHFLFVWKDFNPTDSEKPVSGLSDILVSTKNYYNLSGGRALPHFLTFCFVNLPKCIFNTVNSLMFVFLGIIIRKISFGENNTNAFCQLMIYFSLLFFITDFGDNILWLSGAVNYLWTSVLFLTAIYLLGRFIESKKLSDIITAIIAGGGEQYHQ